MVGKQVNSRPLGCATAIVLALLFALYVLSIGPTRLFVVAGSERSEIYRTVYAPVLWVTNNAPPPLNKWMSAYLTWWDQWEPSE